MTKKFRRLGGIEDLEVDVRIIAATNRHLARMIQQHTFREDLYYRLNVLPIHIPPLRDRGDDVLLLAAGFIRKFNESLRKQVDGMDRGVFRETRSGDAGTEPGSGDDPGWM